MHYFLLNKPQDYGRSQSYHCVYDREGITLDPQAQEGSFFSRLFDGKEADLSWHRLCCQSSSPLSLHAITLRFYCSNQPHCLVENTKRSILQVLQDPLLSLEEKIKAFRPFLRQTLKASEDSLLHPLEGQYLWFQIDFRRQQVPPPVLKDFVLYFPKSTWTSYLPSVYQKNLDSLPVLEQFLSLFQSVYDDVDQAIEGNARLLSPQSCPPEFISFLAELLDLDHVSLWEEEKMRQLLSLAPELFRKKGTLSALETLLALYTGEPAFVVEDSSHCDLDPEIRGKLLRFYGNDPTEITILLRQHHLQGRNRAMLRSLISGMMPVQTQFRLVELRDHMLLGEHTYLGINTKLERYHATALDGNTFLDFTTIATRQREEHRP